MKKITVTIQNNSLVFKYRTNKVVGPNLLNTNVISNNELVFSDDYIRENFKIVGLFIADLAKEKDINEIVVSNNTIGELVIDIVKKISNDLNFTILDNCVLSYALCDGIAKTKNIKHLTCYGLPQFMMENLDKYGVSVESRSEVLFTSNFMADNNLTSFSKIYYKNSIKISEILGTEDINDIRTFLTINKYLKSIHFEKYTSENLNLIIKILKEMKIKNVSIQIHDDLEDEKELNELRELNKNLQKKDKIKLTLVYSKDYLEKNYMPQIIFTTLKMCALIIFVIILSIVGYIVFNNYNAELQVTNIKEEIIRLMEEDALEKENNKGTSSDDSGMINSYNVLYKVNSDSVGWLTVRGTKIDYPVVRSTDNSYYLKRNIYKEQDYNGWVFMDYRNNIDELDDHTIIYAHNRYTSGVMFGTLPNIRKNNWIKDESNYVLTFNTLYKEGKWKIFSFYGIDVTNDYLITTFNNVEDKEKFIKMITDRSEVDFDVEVTAEDKILTLSTCLDNDQRFVVHAVLMD